MHRSTLSLGFCGLMLAGLTDRTVGQQVDQDEIAPFRQAALAGGDAKRGQSLFESDTLGCKKCHALKGEERRAGPNLGNVGDKFAREQLIVSVLDPNFRIHPDYGTIVAVTTDGKSHSGVLLRRTKDELQLLDAEGKPVRLPLAEIEQEQRPGTSLMPTGVHKTIKPEPFADLIAYLETQKSQEDGSQFNGMPGEIPAIARPIGLVPLFKKGLKYDHPVWVIPLPGTKSEYLVVEQMTRKIWRVDEADSEGKRELFADFSEEASTGDFEGVVCLAFHPKFLENRKYYVNYHVRNQGCVFSPVIVERQAAPDYRRDSGKPSRRLLQIPQDTDLHWGGMLAFGPDGYLYIGAGDAGPQEDPEGHGQDLGVLTGAILRIDVDRQEGDKPYAIPESNPFRNASAASRPEIWASGFRMPWRFSFDPVGGDLWVGDVGQDLFEEVTIARAGENHGWNVHEGFLKFSDRYRRDGETYTPPVLAYRRKYGSSVTGGFVYRGKQNKSYEGACIFGDFESKRIFALTQKDRQLVKVRQIGESPERISSFGVDHDGELLMVGYEGNIFRLALADSSFEAEPQSNVNVSLVRSNAPAAARVSIVGGDGKSHAPEGAAVRQTKRNESYFYADGSFEVKLPEGQAKIELRGGIETIPQTLTIDGGKSTEMRVELKSWIDMASRGWYSGDSHVHLHTGGPISVGPAEALVAAKAEGVNYVNLCVSNNFGDDIRDAGLISGKPDEVSTDKHLLVFGEEMRSTIYGHMQFFGINKLVEPQYTGFDDTPNRNDFPANFDMAVEAVRQGGVVTYGHPMFAGQPYPFGKDSAKSHGAARELPIDAILGKVQAVDLMSYNCDEPLSAELWYKLLNCGFKLSACVGTDALLDRSTEPLGGDRVYVKVNGPLTMASWLEGLKNGRTFVTNGPITTLEVGRKGPGESHELAAPGSVRVSATVESYVPFDTLEILVNGKVATTEKVEGDPKPGARVTRFNIELPIERSSWIALRVRGADNPLIFDGPVWAHTSPVYVKVAGAEIGSQEDAKYFVEWIDGMLEIVATRNRYEKPEDRAKVEALFRKAQDEFRKLAEAK
ncbi:CehA/McbA family metallohydrolase [Singulisphaera sp. PoT]|uniref:CehA/McbA family metallohydrolase n=1 Tax=Singulisphaera sp. PoT TaxID=3411797 RepID=UPI003BF53A8E